MVDLYRGYDEGLLTEEPTRFSDIGVSGPDFLRGMKYTPFDFVGAPVDLLNMGLQGIDAMYGQRNVLGSERPFLGSEDLINRYADLGGLMGVDYDRPTGSGSETLGRVAGGILAPTVGAQTVGRVVDAGADYIAGAPARVAGRARSVTLGSGIDPTAALDDMIVRGMGDNGGVSPADTPRGLLDQPQAAQGEPVGLLADDPVRQMDTAQARYFEAGKFEPPTAENPVSIVPPTENEFGIIAFHGSGADFDEFRLEMIGTGEGAQTYGYGLYFTDSEDIAKFYRDAVGGKNINRMKQFDDIGQALKGKMTLTTDIINNIIDKKIKVSSLPKEAQSSVKEILKRKEPPKTKKMYKVGLAPKPDELLDYDAPLSQQPKKYKAALDEIAKIQGIPVVDQFGQSASFSSFQDALNRKVGPVNAMREFTDAGIPGLKYRAAGSRAATTVDEAAKRNYVIFDDKAVKILEKYGIAGPVLVTGAGMAREERPQPAGGIL
jgi:hypothetical protein